MTMSYTLNELASVTKGFNGFPDSKSERWRFSQIGTWLERSFEDLPTPQRDLPVDTPYTVVIENGELFTHHLPEHLLLTTKRYEHSHHRDNPFAPFNQAYATSLQLSCSVSPDAPVHIIYRYDTGIRHSSLKLLLESGVELELVESFSGGGSGFITHHSDLGLQPKSRLKSTLVQDLDKRTAFISEAHLTLYREASAELFALLKGAAFHQHFTACELSEKSSARLHALQLARTDQRHVLCTDFIHLAPSSTSFQLAKQVLDDNGVGVFDGKALITREAAGAVARQGSHALLLCDKAQIHAKTHLEIYTDDLQASHGSTVGQLDEEAMTYLQSRGIPKPEARRMMIDAFTSDLLESIENPAVRKTVETIIGGHHDAQSL